MPRQIEMDCAWGIKRVTLNIFDLTLHLLFLVHLYLTNILKAGMMYKSSVQEGPEIDLWLLNYHSLLRAKLIRE